MTAPAYYTAGIASYQKRLGIALRTLVNISRELEDEWCERSGAKRMPSRGSDTDDLAIYHEQVADAIDAIEGAWDYGARYLTHTGASND